MRPCRIEVALALAMLIGPAARAQVLVVASPNGRYTVTVALRDGRLTYAVARDGRPVLHPSRLGMAFQGQRPLDSGYVALYSPLQMAADLPEHYENQPAFQFIRDVAVDWDTTRVIDGRIGDYVIVARRERDGQQWFIGAITDEEGRSFDVPLSFLTPGRRYVAEIYADGPGAHWLTNPFPVTITSRPVTSASRLRMVLAPGGGQAVRIRPAR